MKTPSIQADGECFPSAPSFRLSGTAGEPEEAEDQDVGDLPSGVDEDALEADELDTDRIADNS